jgi:hypothetical protein
MKQAFRSYRWKGIYCSLVKETGRQERLHAGDNNDAGCLIHPKPDAESTKHRQGANRNRLFFFKKAS